MCLKVHLVCQQTFRVHDLGEINLRMSHLGKIRGKGVLFVVICLFKQAFIDNIRN